MFHLKSLFGLNILISILLMKKGKVLEIYYQKPLEIYYMLIKQKLMLISLIISSKF